MEKITSFFLNRKMLVNVIIITTVIYGLHSLNMMNKEAIPEVSTGQIVITTIYPGASARDVEMNVTVPIEIELKEVSGIKEVISSSNEGLSIVTVIADEDFDDDQLQQLYEDIDSSITKIDDLPNEIDGKPTMSKITSDDQPFIEIAFQGEYKVLYKLLNSAADDLRQFPDISQAEIIGVPDPEVHILVDPLKAKKEYIGLRTIIGAIEGRNLEGSGGTLESFVGQKKVVSINKFEKYDEVLDTILRMSPDSSRFGVRLRDVATLSIEPEDVKLKVRNSGKPGASIVLKKKKGGNILRGSRDVHNYINKLKLPPGVTVSIISDQSKMTRDRLELTVDNAIMGFILVMIILFLIFDFKTAFWTAFGIPFSLFFAFIILYASGQSINMISLGGFIVVIGILVDDAIIIAEAYKSNTEKGMNNREAAVEAVRVMWKPVLAATTTTALAFSPIMNLGGLPGKFVWILPLVVIIALLGSLIDVYFFLPPHLVHEKRKKKEKRVEEKKAFVLKLEKNYHGFLERAVKLRYPIIAIFIAVFFLSVFTAKNFLPKDPFPQDSAEGFTVSLTFPNTYGMKDTEKAIIPFEKIISAIPENELVGYSVRMGTNSTYSLTTRGVQENIATMFIYLTPYSTRDRTAFEIIKDVRDKINAHKMKDEFNYLLDIMRVGAPLGKEFEVRVAANDREMRMTKVKEIKKYLLTLKGVKSVDDDYVKGKDEINIRMNHNLIASAKLSVKDILTALRISFDGMKVTSFRDVDGEMNYRLRLNKKARADMGFIKSLPVMNSLGNMVNLGAMIYGVSNKASGEIIHYNGKRTTTVFGNIDPQKISGKEVIDFIAAKFPSDKNVEITFGGQPVEGGKIFGSLGNAALIAAISIFLVISLIFNSFTKPLLIIAVIPFTVAGVIFALFAHGYPLSLFAGIAIVGLMGIIVNDSIVMIHTVEELKEEETLQRGHIIDGAVSRLRPILLTSFTTIMGLFPTAYAIGGYDPFLSQMCVGLAWGLLFGLTVVLIFLPSLYVVSIDLHHLIEGLKNYFSNLRNKAAA